jgi:endonuclease G, mitochondrial
MRNFGVALATLAVQMVFVGCVQNGSPEQPVPTLPPMGSGPARTLTSSQPAPATETSPQDTATPVTKSKTETSENPIKAQMLLGNPDNAASDTNNKDHYLMRRLQYALSFNETLHFPNWVAWHLQAQDIGDTDRGAFVPDPDLPRSFTRITTRDYVKTGYDRGHNCPSKDRTASREDNDVAFYMTNITPQQHGMNAGPWEGLENYSRSLATDGNELYITCGHGFNDKTFETIGPKNIAVPSFGWKVIVVLSDRTGDDLARIKKSTRVIAIKMPNISTVSKRKWQEYLTTPAEIEKVTGMRFFTNLPPDVAEALRQKKDDGGMF